MKTWLSCLGLVLCFCNALASQPIAFIDACDDLSDGEPLRLVLPDGTSREGVMGGRAGASLLFMDEYGATTTFAEEEVAEIWALGRASGTGAIAGGFIGGLLGGVAGASLASLGNALNENGADRSVVGPAIVGALACGTILGLVGAGVGSVFPEWRKAYPRNVQDPEEMPTVRAAPPTDRPGGIRIGGGPVWSTAPGQDDAGTALHMAVFMSPSDATEFGIEAGRYPAGPAAEVPGALAPADDDVIEHVGLMGRLYILGSDVRPFITGGFGFYNWTNDYMGPSLGGGVSAMVGPRLFAHAEYRHHLGAEQEQTDPEFGSVFMGVSWIW